ncbi:hypothetical protein V6N12_054341 [Hibiscus sabdariffa]|uniref:DUF4283 domain-containing protein n=1 Tax=Hibiscus sabdariffa TaxID=183260 RepID=A0ABR2D0H4_9ROSI
MGLAGFYDQGLDLGEFPPLGGGSVGAATGGETNVGVVPEGAAPAWNLLDQTLSFFPPEKKDGKACVSPPPAVLSRGAQQWSNALISNFLGKSPTLSVFQRTANRLWGREGAVEIRFLESVYIINGSLVAIRQKASAIKAVQDAHGNWVESYEELSSCTYN